MSILLISHTNHRSISTSDAEHQTKSPPFAALDDALLGKPFAITSPITSPVHGGNDATLTSFKEGSTQDHQIHLWENGPLQSAKYHFPPRLLGLRTPTSTHPHLSRYRRPCTTVFNVARHIHLARSCTSLPAFAPH
ncbi:hypothetical protein FIBSPDRAFT_931655 [Athelia psychrophila]|uniref:Uncharacterized protein n=1 Tax=Athelia psychrophila TaxID=1759441 RepID=A0A166K1F8_9AGAM|nr:hypothetical protein FIBSPDRAFT_931655 [Fibularhizoctonia sp. CBS 109695]